MKFTVTKTSRYGTAFLTTEGSKKAIAVPGVFFPGGASVGTELEITGVELAPKAERKQNGVPKEVREKLTPDQKKQLAAARRDAERRALEEMGALSL